MRIYLVTLDGDTASAEKEETARKLEARGYLRCTYARWKAARQARDAQDQRRLAVGDEGGS